MDDSPKLPQDLIEVPSGDFSSLRQEGIKHLGRLSGRRWSDYNSHDPGITILEQFCYALTDLAYRIQYQLPDLLTREGKDPYAGFYTPARILTSEPVTLTDLRTLIVDLDGVKNAWIEVVDEPLVPAYFDAVRREVSLTDNEVTSLQIGLKGLYRVLIEKSDLADIDGREIVRKAAQLLHAHRGLGEDFEEIRVLDLQEIRAEIRLEIAPVEDQAALLANIYQEIATYCSPGVTFYTLEQMLERGWRVDEIFEGPVLQHGFIDAKELARFGRRSELRVSELIHRLMEITGVLAVQSIRLAAGDRIEDWQDWLLKLDLSRTPRFDPQKSRISLVRKELIVAQVEGQSLAAFHQRTRRFSLLKETKPADRDLQPPIGRDRKIGKYHSLQYQFPAVYGIGAAGLPESASPERQARARQLKAYLLFFDQLLANSFAQLAQAGELFSFDGSSSETYFSQPVADHALRLDELRQTNLEEHRKILRDLLEPELESDFSGRTHRFLNHLLARFGEQITDYSPVDSDQDVLASEYESQANDKRAFLRQYPRISSARGTAFNSLRLPSQDDLFGLERRLRLKLGLHDPSEQFYVVEHILLRPIEEDDPGALPLFGNVHLQDPYSLQVSLVFPSWPERFQDPNFRRFITQMVREETPAHLTCYLHWLEQPAVREFAAAFWACLEHRRNYLSNRLGLSSVDPANHFQVRGARDRLIDLLGIGDTYPLADLRLRDDQLTVAFTNTAKILIEDAQPWVVYELQDAHHQPVEKEGTLCQISLLFLATDFKDPSALAKDLRGQANPFARSVWGLFPVDIKGILKDPASTSSQSGEALIRGLNSILSGLSLYDDLVGAGLTPSVEASRLTAKKPQGAQLVLLNRLLLEDAYPKEIINRRSRFQTDGRGVTVLLETPAVREDITYGIFARKYQPEKGRTAPGVRLQGCAAIKVGLDKSLSAEILDAPPLDPAAVDRIPAEPRIIDYGTAVKVRIRKSQEGVDYRLVYFKPGNPAAEVKLSDGPDVRGDLDDIILSSGPINEDEDIDLRIRASKTLDPSERRASLTDLLEVALPLRIRARRTLRVAVEPSPIVNYQQGVTVKIEETQKSAKYRLYFCAIPDRDFVHGGEAGQEVIKVSEPREPNVEIRKPLPSAVWQELEDYQPLGDPQSGNGGDLSFTLKALSDDTLIVIQALKEHLISETGPGPKFTPSAVQLDQAAVILVRPNPAPQLTLRVPLAGSKTDGTIQVSNGQPGVFYFFRQSPKGKEFSWPAYFHQRDHRDGTLNKGLGQFGLEIDFVIAANPAAVGNVGSPNPAKTPPEPPLLETGPLNADNTLYLRAVKAQTQISTPLVDTPQIGLLPEIRPEQSAVDMGSEARILVIASKPDEKYQVMLNGNAVKRALNGNGKDLVVITDPLRADTTFEVVVTRPAEQGIRVERLVQIPVQVKPK